MMTDERYPLDLVVTRDDFSGCGWKEVLADSERDYASMWHAFSPAAGRAMASGRRSTGKVLWLLADACSMMLSPQSPNEPFKPGLIIEGKRSAISEDFTEQDIAFFAEIVEVVDDARLKGRLADLVWLLGKPRDANFALVAIDAYRSIPLSEHTWVRDAHECWARALGLARMLDELAGERLREMEVAVLSTLDASTEADGFLGLWLAELLLTNRLGRQDPASVARKLETIAGRIDIAGDFYRAGELLGMAREWFLKAGDTDKATEMTVALAESWVKLATTRVSSSSPSHMVATDFYEKAIQTYRTIPRSERASRHVDERIAELHKLLGESGQRSLEEMGRIQSPGVDITRLVEHARAAVRGKSAIEALRALAGIHPGARVKSLRENALKMLREHPLRAIFPATTMSRDGRVIAKRPGLSLGDTLSEEDEITIRSEMIGDYGIMLGLAVHGEILPALEVMLMEHRLREADFVELARQSPVVPVGREHLFGKALYAGYDRDLIASIHVLIPQIEHMVRVHLKGAGVKTTTLDSAGIETESGLSTLMSAPEAQTVFGGDLAFEISALLCDAHGPNLRNELAHGLLDDGDCHSVHAIYVWWLALKLVFNAYWVANCKENANDSNQGEA
jgi:hypothetical protein